jgi:hypothetical protein
MTDALTGEIVIYQLDGRAVPQRLRRGGRHASAAYDRGALPADMPAVSALGVLACIRQ